jgi:molybdopterin converting factor subunit 1
MHITVRFFALARDRAGVSQIELDFPPGASVANAAQRIAELFPELNALLPRIAFAVNQSYVDRSSVLRSGDELALIPPVSGGS